VPAFVELGVTYTVHLWLVGKCVVDFLLVLIEIFCQLSQLRRYERIGAYRSKSWFSKGVGHFERKFQWKGISHQQLQCWRQKTRAAGLLCGVVCVILLLAVLIQYQRVADRHAHTQTNRHTMTANTRASIKSTCRMGSHSVTCHPAVVRIPPLTQAEAGTRFSDPGGM